MKKAADEGRLFYCAKFRALRVRLERRRVVTHAAEDTQLGHRPQLELARRSSTFEEVKHPLDQSNALYEARRCLSCGNCFSCDNCYGVCPDNAVLKLGANDEPYRFDYDYCKGCGICAAECPCGAIEMVPEEI